MENRRACTYKCLFSTWPVSWQTHALLPTSCAQLPTGCAICKHWRMQDVLLYSWPDTAAGTPTNRRFTLSSSLSFDLYSAGGSTQGMLFHSLYVPFLQACLNWRNRIFLTTSKSSLMSVKSSTAVALQVQDILSQGLAGNNQGMHGRDMLQVTCACCSRN